MSCFSSLKGVRVSSLQYMERTDGASLRCVFSVAYFEAHQTWIIVLIHLI